MRDFSLKTYKLLLDTITKNGYACQTVEEFTLNPANKAVVLRHDVDSWPQNAYQMAVMENKSCLKATYYFRKSPMSFHDKIIRSIVSMGHEIGYHYEDLASQNGDYQKAINTFQNNLNIFRQYYPVKTIVMHGRPLSKWDNLDIWQHFDFKAYGIIAEPYMTYDFDRILYLTDTGNCWDGHKYSVRDCVDSKYSFSIHSTFDLVQHLDKKILPDQIMLNLHPSRWNDNVCKWFIRYYILTLPKYQIKRWLKVWRTRKK